MEGFSERRFSIDAGMGKKMDGCPYSIFEDGHDVEDYIIPPKGFVFTGFKYVPTPDNQIYDGRLVAQYEREPLKERLFSVMHYLVWILIIAVIIGIITVLTIGVFKPQKPQNREAAPQNKTPLPYTDTVAFVDTLSYPTSDSIEVIQDSILSPEPEEKHEEIEETTQPVVTDNNELFKTEFWALIHQREMAMDAYDELYKKNKGKVSGEEFDYLRFTILKDYQAFKEWSSKLRKTSSTDIATIETIDALKNKLKEIN